MFITKAGLKIGEVWARTDPVQFVSSSFTLLFIRKWIAMVESEACAMGMWIDKLTGPSGG